MQVPRLEFNVIIIFNFLLKCQLLKKKEEEEKKEKKSILKGQKKKEKLLYNYHKCLELQCEFLFKRKHE